MTDAFQKLLHKREQCEYDDEYLTLLITYHQKHPYSEIPAVFMGYYALHFHNDAVALEYAKKAYAKRPLNREVWQLLVLCYNAVGDTRTSAYFQALLRNFYDVSMDLTLPRGREQETLDLVSLGLGIGNYAPFLKRRVSLQDGHLHEQRGTFAGEYIPRLYPDGTYRYWVGSYVERENQDAPGWMLEHDGQDAGFVDRCGSEFVFDIMRAREVQDVTLDPQGKTYLVPLGGREAHQQIDFESPAISMPSWLGQYAFNFYRITEPTRIHAEHPFMMSEPICLEHSPKRYKVVLNILVDALSWSIVRDRGYVDVPHILKFFRKGVIFDQNFSTSEYTFPSFAAIEAGMYPHHTQVFNERAAVEMSPDFQTMSEQMKKLGYYCTNVVGMAGEIYTGGSRGFDRLICNGYDTPAYKGVERAIRQMEAFSECDQYMLLHLMDVHVWSAKSYYVPIQAQTKLSLHDRLVGGDTDDASVYIAGYELYKKSYIEGIRMADRNLGVLFDYLEQHYAADEFVVNLYSDHGASVFDPEPYILSEHHVGSALMTRGPKIPARGLVTDELTSSLDLYPILAYQAGFPVPENVDGNLPQALGGQAREYVVSTTNYPGQVFRCNIRTKEYEYQVWSQTVVDVDGTVDLEGALVKLFRRKDHQQIHDAALEQYFLDILWQYTEPIRRGQDQWPSLREGRPEWYKD